MDDIQANIQQVRATIAQACANSGRQPASVTIIAVSKTKPVADLVRAYMAGMRHFGENRVEEGEWKIAGVNARTPTKPIWHMIGHIQSRKAKQIPALFDVVHSVDSVKLASKLAEQAQVMGKRLSIFLEMNVSGEATKEGLQAVHWQDDSTVRTALWQTIEAIGGMKGLDIRGLMTMAPFTENVEDTRPIFRELAQLRVALRDSFGWELPDLSMGMTNDYPIAIEEGATMVRIGRAIFGDR